MKNHNRKLVESTVSFLKGRRRELISDLKKQMDDASEELNYEEAACLRDRIAALEHDSSKTKCGMGAEKRTGHSPPQDQDVVGITLSGR